MLGAGVQARSHLRGPRPRPARASSCRSSTATRTAPRRSRPRPSGRRGIGAARWPRRAREAPRSADVVVTAASFAPADERQSLTADWLAPDALVVAVDYATYVPRPVARDAGALPRRPARAVPREPRRRAFDGYPDPGATIGEAILGGHAAAAAGRVVVTHLGVGLADLVFGDAIVRRATERGLGDVLPR